jgi:hypothetical protein
LAMEEFGSEHGSAGSELKRRVRFGVNATVKH